MPRPISLTEFVQQNKATSTDFTQLFCKYCAYLGWYNAEIYIAHTSLIKFRQKKLDLLLIIPKLSITNAGLLIDCSEINKVLTPKEYVFFLQESLWLELDCNDNECFIINDTAVCLDHKVLKDLIFSAGFSLFDLCQLYQQVLINKPGQINSPSLLSYIDHLKSLIIKIDKQAMLAHFRSGKTGELKLICLEIDCLIKQQTVTGAWHQTYFELNEKLKKLVLKDVSSFQQIIHQASEFKSLLEETVKYIRETITKNNKTKKESSYKHMFLPVRSHSVETVERHIKSMSAYLKALYELQDFTTEMVLNNEAEQQFVNNLLFTKVETSPKLRKTVE